MLNLARRLAGLVVTVVMMAGLPLAAARAGCICDHGHQHGAAPTAAAPHTCTAACTAATCPMHRKASSRHGSHAPSSNRDGMRCSCAGDAQALIGQATPTAVLTALTTVAPPPLVRVLVVLPPDAPTSLQPSPPAPPPRA
ncbi:MAG: hypothetical protein ABIT71_00390 [Vicinamibacteraceae bacterium]